MPFLLQLTSKQLEKQSKRVAKEEATAKAKVAQCIRDGDGERCRIYAATALRKKGEALQLLRLSGRVDAAATRVRTAASMSQVSNAMARGVVALEKLGEGLDLISDVMEKFESTYEDLEVHTNVAQETLVGGAGVSARSESDEVEELIRAMKTEHEMDVALDMPDVMLDLPEVPNGQVNRETEFLDLDARIARLGSLE
ncbi:Vacuolar-sorting protein SNF7 [Irineochytrium annulatum]|nr:Vacuolar-sorting protein SNF7 [Irineochytrium annulatum]